MCLVDPVWQYDILVGDGKYLCVWWILSGINLVGEGKITMCLVDPVWH